MVDQAASRETTSWSVPPEFASARLDVFARRCLPHLSRRQIDKAIGEKLFLLHGRAGKKGDRLDAGDRLTFCGPVAWLAEQPPPAAELDIRIVYEDAVILALDKPAGVATHGFSARDNATLANFLLARWPELLNVGKSRWEPGLVHRLDVETSGLVLVAKTQAAFDRLRAQFRRREIRKIYWALVWGDADADGAIDFPLAHDAHDPRRMRAVKQSRGVGHRRTWAARTNFRKLGAARGLSLLEIDMVTGVTHQIRVHLAAIGHPILGDHLYAVKRKETFGLRRHFLHAKSLTFGHPDDDRVVKLESELPSELRDVLELVGIVR